MRVRDGGEDVTGLVINLGSEDLVKKKEEKNRGDLVIELKKRIYGLVWIGARLLLEFGYFLALFATYYAVLLFQHSYSRFRW